MSGSLRCLGFRSSNSNLNQFFLIFCCLVGCVAVIILLINYFTFPFKGVGITLVPDLGFMLSLIAGISAIGAGILDIIVSKNITNSE